MIKGKYKKLVIKLCAVIFLRMSIHYLVLGVVMFKDKKAFFYRARNPSQL